MTTRLLGKSFQNLRLMLKKHPDLFPLVGACSFAGSIAVFTMLYTSVAKSDVVYNRWTAPAYQAMKSGRADEKLYVVPMAREAYNFDIDSIRKLLDEVYEDGRYAR